MTMRPAGPRIIDRYLMKEMLGTHLAVTLVLLLIILGGTVARMLREAAEGRIPADVLLSLVALGSIRGLILLLPVSLFLALMLSLGRLYKDSEMAALQACGVGPGRLSLTIAWVTVPMVVLLALLVFWGAPLASERIEQVRAEAQQRSDLSGIAPGRFLESRVGGRVFFIEGYTRDGGAMRDVFIQSRGPGGTEVVTARRAETRVDPASGQRYLVLHDGFRYVGEPGEQAFRILEFETQGVRVPDPEGAGRRGRADSQPTGALLGSRNRLERAELQWRISIPVSMVLLAVLALPLSHTTNPRQGRFARITGAIVVYVLYANFLILAKSWYGRGQTPEWLGMWWVHVALAVLIVVLLLRQQRLRVWRRRVTQEAGA